MKLFGTFTGVFVPSFEALFGAVLFLILPGLVAQIGIWQSLLIIVLANTATIATAFSIGDCASNLENIGAGGMYAIAKRSLGKAFGGAIGIQLFLAQAVSIGFYAIGFALPLQKILAATPFFAALIEQYALSSGVQIQIIATLIAMIAFISGLVGADFVSKIQMVIFVILTVSVGSILFTPFMGIKTEGIAAFSNGPNFSGLNLNNLTFWVAFAIFFPAVTGIDAGVGMSGSLKDPRKSLAKGTFLAIAVTGTGYILVSIVFGFINPELILAPLKADPTATANTASDLFSGNTLITVLITLGIVFATGSSALAYFLTAPRTVQALARDGILPDFLSFLGRDFKKDGNEPRWGTVLTFLIVVPIIWAGDVTFASMIVGICFLVVYGWVNLAAFFERISGNPSFRPTSKGHWLISLYGFLIAMVTISLFNIWVGLLVIASQLIIFMLLLKYKSNNKLEGVWWGLNFSLLASSFRRMQRIIQGSKNWRPIVGFFCFADKEVESQSALEIARWVSSYKGISLINVLSPMKVNEEVYTMPEGHQIVNVRNNEYEVAINSIMQSALPGGLEINTAFLPLDSRLNLVATIEDLMTTKKNVLLYKSNNQSAATLGNSIDVWWKGEENGNLMALLSYIIIQSDEEEGRKKRQIRLIRKLFEGENKIQAQSEMANLMQGARLKGEVLILPDDDDDIHTTISRYSRKASLILIGMPGKRSKGLAKVFALDKLFFGRELHKFDEMPPVLFVKAADTMSLIE